MPIGKEEWNLGSRYDTFEKQLLSFLRKNQDAAYTLPEIVSALGYKMKLWTWEVLLVALLVFGCFRMQ